MADISELVLEVKNKKALQQLDQVDKKLTSVGNTGFSLGQTLLAGWSFTKLIQAAKHFGDAFKDVEIVFNHFDRIFGSFNSNADKGVRTLINDFNETERSAKKLMGIIGSRIDFGFSRETTAEMTSTLAGISENMAMVFGSDLTQMSQKLTSALAGEVDGLKEVGIIIDKESPKFKEMVETMRDQTGETEKAARAMVIYNEIIKSTEKYNGAFAGQAKTLSQALGDISNTLQSGIFAEAGKYISSMLVPALEVINKVLSIPLVATVTGFTIAIGGVLGGLALLQVAIKKAFNLIKKMADETSNAVLNNLKARQMEICAIQSQLSHLWSERDVKNGRLKIKGLSPHGNIKKFEEQLFKEQREIINKIHSSEFTGSISDIPAEIVSILGDSFSGVRKLLAKAFSPLTDVIFNFAKSFSQTLGKALTGIVGLVTPAIHAMSLGIAKVLSTSFKGIGVVLASIAAPFKMLFATSFMAAIIGGLKIAGLSLLKWLGIALTGIFSSVGTIITGLVAGIAQIGVVVAAEAGNKTAQAIVDAETKVMDKILLAIGDFFLGIGERIKNIFTKFEFSTDQGILDKNRKTLDQMFSKNEKIIQQTTDSINEYFQKLSEKKLSPIDLASKAKKGFDIANSNWEKAEKEFREAKREKDLLYARSLTEEIDDSEIKKVSDKFNKAAEERSRTWKVRARFEEKNNEAQKKLLEYEKEGERLAKEREDAKKREAESFRQTTLDFYNAHFDNFKWMQDKIHTLIKSYRPLTLDESISEIDKQMERLQRSFEFRNSEQLVDGYKEMGELEMQKFQMQIDHLNKEKEAIQSTNELIRDFFMETMKFKAQGVGGIAADTQEGYKFLTSSIKSQTIDSSILDSQKMAAQNLQRKQADLAGKTYNVIKEIKKLIDLNTKKTPTEFAVVN